VQFAEAFMSVSRTDWACLGLILLGIILFLIGANYYNAFAGWFGVFLFVGGVLAWIARYVYGMLVKRQVQKP
jgi:membrane-bound ClpP family serine protease